MATTGERIKQLRTKKGLSQSQLAELIGVKKNTVSTWERGTRKPDFPALDSMSNIFEVSIGYIVGDSEDLTPIKKPTEEELNELALSNLADEAYDVTKKYCRLGAKSQRLVNSLIDAAYRADQKDGELLPRDPFEITITPKKYDSSMTEDNV